MDNLSPEKRSWTMSRVKCKNTKPELVLRSMLHRSGFRFTVNGRFNRELPGHPDIVLPKYRSVIFVHGCFWHRHAGCKHATFPKTNASFWNDKFEKNIKRDNANLNVLREMGWNVIVVWECELKNTNVIMRTILNNLFCEDELSEIETLELIAAEEISEYEAMD